MLSQKESFDYCRRISKTQAGNFYLTFHLLPKFKSDSMCALYAFMRITDDIADEPGEINSIRKALGDWRESTLKALNGQFSHPIHPAFVSMVQRHEVPHRYLMDVLDGVEMDLDIHRYESFEDLYKYCYRVASVVGLCCIHIWGFNSEKALIPAESAGIALQLTNIIRDFKEDFSRGRIYLPREDFTRFGYDEIKLSRNARDESFFNLLDFQATRAVKYYEEAQELPQFLEGNSRGIFLAMLHTYKAILDKMRTNKFDLFNGRVRISTFRKICLLAKYLPYSWKSS